jgi:spoIIIJ-associated protein
MMENTMEWVETTAKTIEEAQDIALDQLGVAADEAEFEVLEEPRSGLFGRVRGEARVRARIKPASVRPKQERRPRGRNGKREGSKKSDSAPSKSPSNSDSNGDSSDDRDDADRRQPEAEPSAKPARSKQPRLNKENKPMENDRPQSDVTPQEVGEAAVAFMSQLATAFGVEGATTDLEVDGTDLEVRVSGAELGLMVGPGGRTLGAIQDLARVASQRRLGDHETRLRIDVGGYREKRRAALEKFAASVAAQVIETGTAKALEPMPSGDRKAVHDAIIEIDGVASHSEGDDPMRRVVITPA